MPTGPADQLPTPATPGQGRHGLLFKWPGDTSHHTSHGVGQGLTREVSGSGETRDSCLGLRGKTNPKRKPTKPRHKSCRPHFSLWWVEAPASSRLRSGRGWWAWSRRWRDPVCRWRWWLLLGWRRIHAVWCCERYPGS